MEHVTLKPAPGDIGARTRAALRGTDEMLIEDTAGNIIVVGVDDSGDKCYLGEVGASVRFQKNGGPSVARAMISRVRFGHLAQHGETK